MTSKKKKNQGLIQLPIIIGVVVLLALIPVTLFTVQKGGFNLLKRAQVAPGCDSTDTARTFSTNSACPADKPYYCNRGGEEQCFSNPTVCIRGSGCQSVDWSCCQHGGGATNTPIPPTNTPIPPTNTPTNTPTPTRTPTPIPSIGPTAPPISPTTIPTISPTSTPIRPTTTPTASPTNTPTPPPSLTCPQVTTSCRDGGAINISWNKVTGGDLYQVKRDDATTVWQGYGNSYTDTSATCGQQHSYDVNVFSDTLPAKICDQNSTTTCPCPSPASCLKVELLKNNTLIDPTNLRLGDKIKVKVTVSGAVEDVGVKIIKNGVEVLNESKGSGLTNESWISSEYTLTAGSYQVLGFIKVGGQWQ